MKAKNRMWLGSLAIILMVGILQAISKQPIRLDNLIIVGLLVWLLFGQSRE